MYQLELDAETFWIRIVCLQVGQSAGSMYTGLPITPCSPASWLVLSYMYAHIQFNLAILLSSFWEESIAGSSMVIIQTDSLSMFFTLEKHGR